MLMQEINNFFSKIQICLNIFLIYAKCENTHKLEIILL